MTKCSHNWKIGSSYNHRLGVSILECKKCGIYMTASEVSQFELWKHATGTQKWLSIGALIVSIIALTITALK